MPGDDILETREEWAGFLSALVHELRTPLGSLLMLADLLGDSPAPSADGPARYARSVRLAAEDIQGLLGEAGELARVLAGHVHPVPEPVALDPLARRLEEAARPLAWEKGATFVLEIDPEVPAIVDTDEALLERLLSLVVRSAIADAPGSVTLRIGRRERRLWIAVGGDGPPFDERSPELAFRPFGEDGRSYRTHGGRGLGLPLARELARRLGGELAAVNRGGRPTVELVLPLRE